MRSIREFNNVKIEIDEQFGNKAFIVYTQHTGVIVGAMGFRNEFDGHTLVSALEQTQRMVGKTPQKAAVDRGYRGRKEIGETQILLHKPFNNKTQSKYHKKKLKEAHNKRVAIEPI